MKLFCWLWCCANVADIDRYNHCIEHVDNVCDRFPHKYCIISVRQKNRVIIGWRWFFFLSFQSCLYYVSDCHTMYTVPWLLFFVLWFSNEIQTFCYDFNAYGFVRCNNIVAFSILHPWFRFSLTKIVYKYFTWKECTEINLRQFSYYTCEEDAN